MKKLVLGIVIGFTLCLALIFTAQHVDLPVAEAHTVVVKTQKQKFVDDYFRPGIESLERFDLNLITMRAQYALVEPQFASDATPYDDGRPDESLDQFNEVDVRNMMTALENFQDTTLIPNRTKIRKVAVRKPEVN